MTEPPTAAGAGDAAEHLAPGWRFPDHLAEQLAALRADFPAEQIGKLPRTTCPSCSKSQYGACDQHAKAKCSECQQYMTPRHMHIDFVGHADVTNRLLEVDPLWSWEPIPDPATLGYPVVPGGLWIYLTVCGVTRPGFGDAEGKTGTQAVKVIIGDALRNAAMRFGVGLALWAKGDRAYSAAGGAAIDAEIIARGPRPITPPPPAAEQVRREQDRAAEQPEPSAAVAERQDRAAEQPDAGAVSDAETLAALQQDIAAADSRAALTAAWTALQAAIRSGALRPVDVTDLRSRWEQRRDAVMTPAAAGNGAPA